MRGTRFAGGPDTAGRPTAQNLALIQEVNAKWRHLALSVPLTGLVLPPGRTDGAP